MIANHPIYRHNYSYHIRGDISPLKWLSDPALLIYFITRCQYGVGIHHDVLSAYGKSSYYFHTELEEDFFNVFRVCTNFLSFLKKQTFFKFVIGIYDLDC